MLRRLTFFALLTFAVVTTASAQSPSMPGMPSMPAGMVMLTPDEMKWGDGPAALPPGLKNASRLPAPIFTPATKAEMGDHDENISFERMSEIVGAELAAKLRDISIRLYRSAAEIAHFAWSKEETVVQVHGFGPSGITYVDPADDPRKK